MSWVVNDYALRIQLIIYLVADCTLIWCIIFQANIQRDHIVYRFMVKQLLW